MQVRIGIQHAAREIGFESSDSAEEIRERVASALKSKDDVLSFTDERGSVYLVPTAAIAYVEIDADTARRVGFVN